MKTLLITADGRTVSIEPRHEQWLEHGGAFFFATEAYNREKPYNGTLVYVEVPREVYERRKLDTTRDILSRWRREAKA